VKNILRDLRKERGITQGDLAEAIEVSRQTINAVEADKYDPSLPMAYRIAAFFDVPVEELFFNPFRVEDRVLASDPAKSKQWHAAALRES